jgi:biotin carboxyl carrier protein
MTRQVTVNGRSGRIQIEGSRLRYVREDGAEVECEFSVERTGSGEVSVLLNGRSYRVSKGAGHEIWVNGRLLAMEVFDPRDLRPGRGASANHGRQEIAASMPGKVIRVLVGPGDAVEEGQGLVVVEAMKMQNEMKSPKAGRVAEVRARPDATVGAGEILVVVE